MTRNFASPRSQCAARAALLALACAASSPALLAQRPSASGIYPHLALYNREGECGIGALVPWQGRLWVITYAPHQPKGSSDRLYEITPELELRAREESIGGTCANRLIHRESQQLFLGPYAIDREGAVRAIPFARMYGRHTGTARHLREPASKVVTATMEEGFYEIDVRTLEVRELFRDEQLEGGRKADLPGYHGKGFYSAQGRYVYANNGEHGIEALRRPEVPSGVLASWDGVAERFEIVQRAQFTEVTGPGGIEGNASDADPLWSLGFDHRSVLLMLLDGGTWHRYRLPKASHSYDGAHGWNTEWPRIRDIGTGDEWLATMHGSFFAFPRGFRANATAGLRPRSSYLKVIGDFARFGEKIAFGCDDSTANEFLNKRRAKGTLAAPPSHSNLWFVEPAKLDGFGPVLARGAVWLNDTVRANEPSDPFLRSGCERFALHLARRGPLEGRPPRITLEIDRRGDGSFEILRTVELDTEYRWLDLSDEAGVWVRLRCDRDLSGLTAFFHGSERDERGTEPAAIFAGLAPRASTTPPLGGLLLVRNGARKTLAVSTPRGAYELDEHLALTRSAEPTLAADIEAQVAVPRSVLEDDGASLLLIDDDGRRWRLPRGPEAATRAAHVLFPRVAREVATERDLFHAGGTFYELPAENAGGFAKMRPIATHAFDLHDFTSYRGLLVLSGVRGDAIASEHLVKSNDGAAALWIGALDDLWQLGKPRGFGGPWRDSAVAADVPSDPFLMSGFDAKRLRLEA
ncbi:MAG: hypothetical protein JNM84_06525, partial [Planctomycetes bacterium]|nr:hypothetical protein [Planctomycetota bacterium]